MKKFPFVFLKVKLTVHCLVPGLAAAISTVLLCTVPVSASAKAAGRSLKTDKTDGAGEVYSSAVSTAGAHDSAENQNPKEKIQILKSDGTPYTFSVLGDSISCYSGIIPKTFNPCYPYGDVTDCREMWWAKTADDLGLVLYADSSAAGSSVCLVPGNNDPGKKSFGDDERLSFLTAADGSVPDIIFVYGGMNDFLITVVPRYPHYLFHRNTDLSDPTGGQFKCSLSLHERNWLYDCRLQSADPDRCQGKRGCMHRARAMYHRR